MVEFEEDGIMRSNVYRSDYTIFGNNRQLIIIITHDEYNFLPEMKFKKSGLEKKIHFYTLERVRNIVS